MAATLLGIKDGTDSAEKGYEKGAATVQKKSLTYYVITANTSEGEAEVLNAAGLPELGDTLFGGHVNNLKPTHISRVRNPVTGTPADLWEVEVSSDSTVGDGQAPTPGDGSDFDSVTVRWSCEKETLHLKRDIITGKPVQTVNGEPIHAEYEISHPVLEIERYEEYPFDPNRILTYVNTVCENEYWGAPLGDALMTDIEVDEYEESGFILNIIRYRVKFWSGMNAVDYLLPEEPSPWQLELLHQGTMYRTPLVTGGGGNKIVRAEDENGNPITVNLDIGGFQLDPDAEPVFLPFNRYRKRDWSELNIDVDDILGL